jgi:hypothetical protein
MINQCEFSTDRVYRYSLLHDIRDGSGIFAGEPQPLKLIAWIGLNPSTADEHTMDPTIRRMVGFTVDCGGNAFVMLNLFAFRSTDPKVLCRQRSDIAIGPENDAWLLKWAREAQMVIACWGVDGQFCNRHQKVTALLKDAGIKLHALKLTKDRHPAHPLYLPKTCRPFRI